LQIRARVAGSRAAWFPRRVAAQEPADAARIAVAGYSLRVRRAWLIRLLAFLLSLLAISATAPPLPSPQLAAR
jgi:hypothetical protein